MMILCSMSIYLERKRQAPNVPSHARPNTSAPTPPPAQHHGMYSSSPIFYFGQESAQISILGILCANPERYGLRLSCSKAQFRFQ